MAVNTVLRRTRAPQRPMRSLLVILLFACLVVGGRLHAAADEPVSESQTPEQLTIAPEEVMKPWTGDLDGMIEGDKSGS